MKNIKYALSALALFFIIPCLYAQEAEHGQAHGNFIIFTMPQNSIQLNAAANESERLILEICVSLGRLLPIEKDRVSYAASEFQDDEIIDLAELARALDASLYMIIDIGADDKTITAEARCFALKAEYKTMEKTITVRSAVPSNIPLKLASEIAALHEKMPVYADITRIDGSACLIEAGQWHGIREGNYSTNIGALKIISSELYHSAGVFQELSEAEKVKIEIYPDTAKMREEINERILENTLAFYKMGKHSNIDDPEKRFITGACFINPGANACLPVYGSFLATNYLGFDKTDLHAPGFAAALFSFGTQLTLTEFMTGFKSNFFPWIKDSDKSAATLRLQQFLWCSIPLTFTISYFDQMAWQMSKTRTLPPFFKNKDSAAAAFSMLCPGGGLMYKGLHAAGWTYYAAEMGLAGFAFYSLGDKKSPYIFGGLGALKAIEIIHAFIAESAYPFYNLEKNGRQISPIMYNEIIEDESIFKMGLAMRFDWNETKK